MPRSPAYVPGSQSPAERAKKRVVARLPNRLRDGTGLAKRRSPIIRHGRWFSRKAAAAMSSAR